MAKLTDLFAPLVEYRGENFTASLIPLLSFQMIGFLFLLGILIGRWLMSMMSKEDNGDDVAATTSYGYYDQVSNIER